MGSEFKLVSALYPNREGLKYIICSASSSSSTAAVIYEASYIPFMRQDDSDDEMQAEASSHKYGRFSNLPVEQVKVRSRIR